MEPNWEKEKNNEGYPNNQQTDVDEKWFNLGKEVKWDYENNRAVSVENNEEDSLEMDM